MSLRDDLLTADTDAEKAAVLDAALVAVDSALAVLTGLSSGELAVLDGVTAGTVSAGKAVIANTQSNIGIVKATALHIGTSGSETQVTATGVELNYSDLATLGTGAASKAVVLDTGEDYTWPATGILTFGVLKDPAGTTLTATTAEINARCTVADIGQLMSVSGAVTAGKQSVLLNHATVAIAATIADASQHFGYFVVKAGLEPGVANDHTCTITTGTWDGVNKIATFADINDALVVFFDHAGNGTIISNTGAVALS